MIGDGASAGMAAAVAAALREPGPDRRELLTSIVSVARAIFGAAAGSILLLDERTGELVFEATAGTGEEHLIGTRFPIDRGIAGWVAATGEAMIVDDLSTSPIFALEVAESTRYVPGSIMAAPVTGVGAVLGVLEVLDPVPQSRSSLGDLDLLVLLARQAGIALRGVARDVDERPDPFAPELDYQRLVGLIRLFLSWDEPRQAAGYQLLESFGSVVSGARQ